MKSKADSTPPWGTPDPQRTEEDRWLTDYKDKLDNNKCQYRPTFDFIALKMNEY